LAKALQKISKAKRGKYLRILVLFALANLVSLNILRKIEQTQVAECQISEYLTLLSSFPDVKKSD